MQDARAAFATSEKITVIAVEKPDRSAGEIHDAEVTPSSSISMPLGSTRSTSSVSCAGLGRTPIIVVTQEFNAAVVRILVQLQIADFLTSR